jgi:pSer/pThr/pTyr-binding forkhead associated (FHA) protein
MSDASDFHDLIRRVRAGGGAAVAATVYLCAATGEVIPLAREVTVLGRATECDVVLSAADVSRRHCRIVRTPQGVIVENLGNSQGTRVNGSPVARARLGDGDRLEMAGQVFQVRLRQPE